MKFLFIAVAVITAVLLFLAFLKRSKVIYVVCLFVQNRSGEVLLIYDRQLGRFVVPYRQVAFDEIPTKVIQTLMTDLFKHSRWDFNYSYHFSDNKYDRIRDDTGPIFMYDIIEKRRKRCVLCYSLKLAEYEDTYYLKKEYPYSEFYTKLEVDEMGQDIIPSEMTRQILQRLMNK